MKNDKLHRFEGREIEVTWSGRRCIHFAACVRGLGRVFEPGRKPWITPDDASADEIADVVRRCPTGALHFARRDGGAAEASAETNSIVPSRHGPLYANGRIEILGGDGALLLSDTRVALCRCGASENKPLCDGSHARSAFRDDGNVFQGSTTPHEGTDPTLRITASTGGPLKITGPVTIRSADGRVEVEAGSVSLCRCGASRNKPFCDGSHARVGFEAD